MCGKHAEIIFKSVDLPPSTIFEMVEASPEATESALASLPRYEKELAIIDEQEAGLFDRYLVLSKNSVYEVVRLGFFVKCSCDGFIKGHSVCKHAFFCLPIVCRKCYETPVDQRGKTCVKCEREAEHAEMDSAIYLKPTSSHQSTRIGSVRI